jgi:hypothetical protein
MVEQQARMQSIEREYFAQLDRKSEHAYTLSRSTHLLA